MSISTHIASAATMGALLVATTLVLRSGRRWRMAPTRRGDDSLLDWLVHDGVSWRVGFVLLTVVAIAGTMLAMASDNATMMLAGIAGAFITFAALGVYMLATTRGHPHSHAVGEAIITVGALTLVAVVADLLLTAGP
jgi:hypothetical protein